MDLRRYVVLPSNGFRSDVLKTGQLQVTSALSLARPGSSANAEIRVLDQISIDGPKLVEMTDDGEIALMREYAGDIRVIPLHLYDRPQPGKSLERRADKTAENADDEGGGGGGGEFETWRVTVTTAAGQPIAGALVVAFTNYRWKEGVSATTGADGIASMQVPVSHKMERLYAYGPLGFWGAYQSSITDGKAVSVVLAAIEPGAPNAALARFRNGLPTSAGKGVRVAVIDTGIARSHPHLHVAGGRNCVFDETLENAAAGDDWDDVDRHGSHVAGIIGGRPAQGVAFYGVAPMAELRAYRVFPASDLGASNFDIMRAIQFAVQDGCHIVNLSLGGAFLDEAVRAAVGDARGSGVLVVAAAGNDDRKPVRYPAAYESVIAVSAIGLRSSFPVGSIEEADVATPACRADPDIFLAGFSNVGPQIKLTAPGVGIVSTVPGGFLAMSGTSMSAPMISGLAAAMLSADPAWLAAPPEERVKDLIRVLYDQAVQLGFGRDHEGAGLPIIDPVWRKTLVTDVLSEPTAGLPEEEPGSDTSP